MSIGRLSASFGDWTGRQNDHGLKVIRLVSLHPPAYHTKCVGCGCETTVVHSKIAYQQCRSSACGQPVRKPSRLERERAEALERERQEEQNALRLAELRMAEETQDYTMPAKRPVTPGNSAPMSERERIEMRQRREEIEAQEAAERETRERPIRELTQQLNETHRRIAEMERQVLTDPKILDANFWHDPQCDGLDFLTAEGIAQWNVAQFRSFAQNHPEFAITDNNLSLLNNYFSKHSVLLFTHTMLERVYKRMIECGIEFDAPKTEEPAESDLDYAQRAPANLTIAPSKPHQEETFSGFDLETGEPREYSAREIDRMSSEQMKRALQMTTRGTLELPHIGPGPGGNR